MDVSSFDGYLSYNKTNIYFTKLDDALRKISMEFQGCEFCIFVDKSVYPYINWQQTRSILGSSAISLEQININNDNKSLQNAEIIINKLLAANANTTTTIIAIGGGCLLDLTGFVASTYMRGMPIIYIPTTIVSQVDSCVGGKNAININDSKNIIGSVYHPEAIYIDTTFNQSLPIEFYKHSLAEVIKHAIINSKEPNELLHIMQNQHQAIIARDLKVLKRICYLSLEVKLDIIKQDMDSKLGIRNILNFGHTVGHAIEKTFNINHGYAVIIGMYVEIMILKILKPQYNDTLQEISDILIQINKYYKFSTSMFELNHTNIEKITQLVLHDKKNKFRGSASISLPYKIGKYCHIDNVKPSLVVDCIKEYINSNMEK